jgi:hypothetical protein
MHEKTTIGKHLDLLGVTLLFGASISLASIAWLTDVLPESVLFNSFYGCLSAALMSFFIGRVADISHVILTTPNRKFQRANALPEAVDSESRVNESGSVDVIKGDFTRAA